MFKMLQKNASDKLNKKSFLAKLFSDNKVSFFAFFCTTIIMLLVFYCFNMVPFGDVTILRMDLYHQYGPLFAELYERVKDGDSLLYSWNTGLGGTFLGNFFNYLASPLFFVIFFFDHVDLPDAIALMILLKSAFASAFFAYYLRKSQGRDDYVTVAFGVLYSFCGFFIAYYWNVMWIDAMALFPLVILGIERIIENKKFMLYTVSLAIIMISNYYMAMMVCIFSVLYFFVRFMSNHSLSDRYDEDKKFDLKNIRFISSGFTFAAASVIAALLALFALLPTVFILRNCSATSGSFPNNIKFYYTIFDFLANHLASVEPTIRSSGTDVLPNVYCGILTVVLIPLYLLSRTIKVKEKIMYVLLLAVMYFSFNINYANYVWHGFHFPNDLPYRFSYMYSFILLCMAFKAICRIREFSGREVLLTGIGVMAFIVAVQEIGSKNVSDNTILISIAFTFVYVLVLAAMQNKKLQAASVSLLLLCCVISESAIANTDNYSMNQEKANYSGDYESFADIKAIIDRNEDFIYRMELSDLRTRMDPAWYDYNGVSTFSSMASEKLSNLQSHLGMYGNYINSYTYNPQTPVYNAMMSLKYIVKKGALIGLENEQFYKKTFENDTYEAYANNYHLPVAFCVDNLVERWNHSDANPFAVQSDFFQRATLMSGVYYPMNVVDVYYNNIYEFASDIQMGYVNFDKVDSGEYGSFTVTVSPEETQNCYLYVDSSEVETIYITGEEIDASQSIDEAYIFDLGLIEKGENVNVEIPIKDDKASGAVEFYAYGIDMEVFEAGYEKLLRGSLQYRVFEETHIEGTVNAETDCILYTSIPYDDGWHITIDGVEVKREDYLRIGDALLGIRMPQGEHEVVFDYEPVGLVFSATVSALTLIILIVCLCLSKKRKKKLAACATNTFDGFLTELPTEQEETDFVLSEEVIAEATEAFKDEIPQADADSTDTDSIN